MVKQNTNTNPDCYPNSNLIHNSNETLWKISRVLLTAISKSWWCWNCSKLVQHMTGNVPNIWKKWHNVFFKSIGMRHETIIKNNGEGITH